jgi:hypothetical protein
MRLFERSQASRLCLACVPEEDSSDIEAGCRHCSAATGAGHGGTDVKKKAVNRYDSVWDALTDTPEQAANLRARTELMQKTWPSDG